MLGGTFDPVHHAHIVIGNMASRTFAGAPVRMLLAARPHLRKGTPAPLEDRWHMLQLACEQEPALVADDTEIRLTGKVSSIDTVEALGGRRERPVIWILGDDAAIKLPRWIGYERLTQAISIFVYQRTNEDLTSLATDFIPSNSALGLCIEAGQMFVSSQPVLDISASAIRCKARQRIPIEHDLHPDVYAHIMNNHFYQA